MKKLVFLVFAMAMVGNANLAGAAVYNCSKLATGSILPANRYESLDIHNNTSAPITPIRSGIQANGINK
jgi:hypothetical protein